jgi:hypothetical protein
LHLLREQAWNELTLSFTKVINLRYNITIHDWTRFANRGKGTQAQADYMGYSNFFFTRPSYLEGVGRVIDTAGVLNQYDSVLTPEEADALAMRSDWAAVGADIAAGIREYKQKTKSELASGEKK